MLGYPRVRASVLVNPSKPLLVPRGTPTALGMSRVEQLALSLPQAGRVLPRLDELVGKTGSLGVVADSNSWYYPFFGPGLKRRVVRLKFDQATPGRIRDEGLAGAVYHTTSRPPSPAIQLAPGYWFVSPAPASASP